MYTDKKNDKAVLMFNYIKFRKDISSIKGTTSWNHKIYVFFVCDSFFCVQCQCLPCCNRVIRHSLLMSLSSRLLF